jgi:hypothetical protein
LSDHSFILRIKLFHGEVTFLQQTGATIPTVI